MLGAAPKPALAGSASWTQIRNRFQPPAEPAAPAAPVKAAPTNIFAGIDDDSQAGAPAPTQGINFKQVIQDRIKREEAERLGLQQDEPTDPQLMTREQLQRNGWAVLSRAPIENGPARTAWFAEYASREMAKDASRDKELEALQEIISPVSHSPPSKTYPRTPAPSAEDVFDDATDDATDDESSYDSE